MYTKIHDKYYDISKFNHPGGSDALSHAYGRDATGLFESYHNLLDQQKISQVLSKYELIPGTEQYIKASNSMIDNQITNFKYDTPFGNEMKSRVREYFTEKAKSSNMTINNLIKVSRTKFVMIIGLSILTIISWLYMVTGNWIALFLFPILEWILMANSFHDSCHFSFSNNQTLNNIFAKTSLSLFTKNGWYHQHNIGHHINTNIPTMDPDLHYAEYILRHCKETDKKYSHQYQKYTFSIEWIMAFLGHSPIVMTLCFISTDVLYNIIHVFNPKQFSKECRYDAFLYILLFIIFPLYFVEGIVKKIIFIIVPKILVSLCFMINTQLTHLHEECMIIDNDWYKHQIETSANFGIGKLFHLFFSGGLSYQIEHHLFPSVNHCHYPQIQSIVEDVCKKHNVKYKKFDGYLEAFKSYHRNIAKLGQ